MPSRRWGDDLHFKIVVVQLGRILVCDRSEDALAQWEDPIEGIDLVLSDSVLFVLRTFHLICRSRQTRVSVIAHTTNRHTGSIDGE